MPSDSPDLRSRLAQRWRDRFPDLPEVGERLVSAYAEPHRVYHDLHHLGDVLATLDKLGRPAGPGQTVELAAWFHDAVYAVGATDNEAASAALADTLLTPYLNGDTVREVTRLVLLTRDHRVGPGDEAAALLCDADLAVLARPPRGYDEYVARVRREYASVPDDDFRIGRAAVLHDLLALPNLYSTPYGRAAWEAPARANLRRELGGLAGD